jgi:hypothetical protein
MAHTATDYTQHLHTLEKVISVDDCPRVALPFGATANVCHISRFEQHFVVCGALKRFLHRRTMSKSEKKEKAAAERESLDKSAPFLCITATRWCACDAYQPAAARWYGTLPQPAHFQFLFRSVHRNRAHRTGQIATNEAAQNCDSGQS